MKIHRDLLVFLVLAGGFFMLIFEVRDLHRDVLQEHWEASIPIWFGVLAFLASFASMAGQKLLRSFATAVFGLGCVVGLFGLFQHSGGEPTKILRPFMGSIVAYADEEGEEHGDKKKESESGPPPLAPMGIAGLSAIGLILAWPGNGERKGFRR